MYNRLMQRKLARFFDECKLAAVGVVLASRRVKFWVVFLATFVVFGTLISLLSSGSSAIDLFFAADFGGKMQILGDGFLTLFGKGREFWDFFVNFSLSIAQALLIALIALIYKKRRANGLMKPRGGNKKTCTNDSNKKSDGRSDVKSDGVALQNAGIATGLALLGSGCPTCGTTLITPILTSIFSTGSYAIAGAISGVLTFLAFVLILWSLKKMGLEAYVIIKDEEWRKKRAVQKVEGVDGQAAKKSSKKVVKNGGKSE